MPWTRSHALTQGLAAAITATAWLSALHSDAARFDDIQFWIGEGDQRAALVIDWSEEPRSPHSLVWGFRFSGEATGRDLLQAVLTADARLYARVGDSGPLGLAVYGLGYDWNGDDHFALSDGTEFDGDGIARTAPADGSSPADADDVYQEGWFASGYWVYATAADDPMAGRLEWESSAVGASVRMLVDGAWDAWTFAPSFTPALPDAALPAPAPSIAGDYDRDLDVDGADLLMLQRSYGATARPFGADADGNHSGVVDAPDLPVWSDHFGEQVSLPITARAVPEPTTLVSILTAALVLLRSRRRIRIVSERELD